jgi:ATPase subunit of ABC transporter with duplicated ATPase domains
MLSIHHISKTYGVQTVLQDISFNISSGERTGLIGPNGCGKTTLLRILAGQEKPDSGIVAHTRTSLRIGYLPQGFDLDPLLTLAEAYATGPVQDIDSALAAAACALRKTPLIRRSKPNTKQPLPDIQTSTIAPKQSLPLSV